MVQTVSIDYAKTHPLRFGRKVRVATGCLKGRTGELVQWNADRVWLDMGDDGEEQTFLRSEIELV